MASTAPSRVSVPRLQPQRASNEAHSLNRQLESEVMAMAEQAVKAMVQMRTDIGAIPPFGRASKRRPEIEAALYLPYWYVYGSAEPPVSSPFWEAILKGIDPVTGKTDPLGGPDRAQQFDEEMLALWETRDPPYSALAMAVMPQEVRDDYAAMRQTGLHLGQPKKHTADWLKDGELPDPAKAEDLGPDGDYVLLLRRMMEIGGKKMADLPAAPESASVPQPNSPSALGG